MKLKLRHLPLLFPAVLALLFFSCSENNIFFSDGSVTVSGPSGSTPSPSPSPDALIAAVFVAEINEACPPGNTPAPAQGQLRDECTATYTCTPKLPDGTDAPPQVHGPAPDSFGVVVGQGNVIVTSTANPFNIDVTGEVASTQAGLQCCVKGRCSPVYTISILP
jgi:hypothetical protein